MFSLQAREPAEVADIKPLRRRHILGHNPVFGLNERRAGESRIFKSDQGKPDSPAVHLSSRHPEVVRDSAPDAQGQREEQGDFRGR